MYQHWYCHWAETDKIQQAPITADMHCATVLYTIAIALVCYCSCSSSDQHGLGNLLMRGGPIQEGDGESPSWGFFSLCIMITGEQTKIAKSDNDVYSLDEGS